MPASAAPSSPSDNAPQRIERNLVARGLYQIVHSPTLHAVFVASTGGFGENAAPSKILRLNAATLTLEAEITLPSKGFSLELDDAAGRLYVGNSLDSSVSVIDLRTAAVIDTVQLAEKIIGADGKPSYAHHTRELCLDTASQRLYAPAISSSDSALYVLNTTSLTLEAVVPGLGYVATGVTLDPASRRLLVSNMQGQVLAIDTTTNAIINTVETSGDQLLNLALDATGNRLFATDQGHEYLADMWARDLPAYRQKGAGNQVLVLGADDGHELARIPTGAGPIDLLFAEEQQRLFVTNRAGRSVTVFDTTSYQLLETIPLDGYPNSLAFDATTQRLFVTVKADETAPAGSLDSVISIAF